MVLWPGESCALAKLPDNPAGKPLADREIVPGVPAIVLAVTV